MHRRRDYRPSFFARAFEPLRIKNRRSLGEAGFGEILDSQLRSQFGQRRGTLQHAAGVNQGIEQIGQDQLGVIIKKQRSISSAVTLGARPMQPA
jgi:hypothetical protein